MSEYQIYLTTTADLTVRVEADDLESAIEKAYESAPGGVCGQCSGWGKRWTLDIGEWDVDEEVTAEENPERAS